MYLVMPSETSGDDLTPLPRRHRLRIGLQAFLGRSFRRL